MTGRILTILAAAVLLTACGTPPAGNDTGGGDTITPLDDGLPADTLADSVQADTVIPADDFAELEPADLPRDQGVEIEDTLPDATDAGDAVEPVDTGADESADIPGPCAHCPNGICDPETLECVECRNDIDCGMSAWCDGGACRDNLCSPGANFCVESTLYRCSNNGGGFTIIQDCLDNDPCTDGEGCDNGRCLTGVQRVCADDNPCTIDYCGVGGACQFYAASDIVCDDGNRCTKDDHCAEGVCVPGGALDCSDINPCTFDYCVSMAGCIHEPRTGVCGDSNGCTSDDRCIEGRCSGDALFCDDGNPCTSDYCNIGMCLHGWISGCMPCGSDQDCDDGDECTGDVCDTHSGVCANNILRTGGCCVEMSDCPPTPTCLKPICNAQHRCSTGALLQSACCAPGILDEAFAGGFPDEWQIEGNDLDIGWRIGLFGEPVDGVAFPAMYFGNADETSYDNGNAVAGSFSTRQVTLPASSAVEFSFRLWQDVDPLGGYDEFTVSVLAETWEGTREFVVWKRPSGFPLSTATDVTLDLSGFSGRTVRIMFAFDSIDEVSNSGRGIYVDDIAISATCRPLSCLQDFHCKSAGINGFCREYKCNFQTSWMEIGRFGSPGSGAGAFLAPTDVAAMPGPEGVGQQILVSDSKTHYVQAFDEDGAFVRMFGGYGVTNGRFLTPRGLQDSEGRVFITDSSGGRIQAMTPAGVFLYKFGSAGIDPGQFDTPRDVAVSNDANLVYVADTGNHRVSVFSRLGVYRYSFGAWGKTAGRFRTPSALAVAPDGNVWVCDTQNNRLQVFSADGVLVRVVEPAGDHALYYPEGIAALKDGRIVVADTYNHRLVILDTEGGVIDTLGSFGTGEGQFNYPTDVDVMTTESEERLVVADAGNFRITIWSVRLW